MSEQNPTPASTEPAESEQTVTEDTTDATTDAQEADGDEAEDWRSNFDPKKAEQRINKLQSEAKNLRERAKTAEQKAAGADEKDKQISKLEAKTLRYEVGYELGLPRELVGRLQGNTRDELIEDAKALIELVGRPKAPAARKPVEALRGGGRPEQQPEERDVRKLAARMFQN